jgi:Ca-activated chloride channel homolog
MKIKAVRTSVAAVLTATLLISLLPLAYAAGQTQQGTNSSKPRRGKNGDPASRGAENPDQGQSSATDRNPETTKPEPGKPAEPPQANPQQTSQSSKSSQSGDPQVSANVPKASDPWGTSSVPQGTAQSQRQPAPPPFDRPAVRGNDWPTGDTSSSKTGSSSSSPAFDRPPLRAGGRPAGDTTVRSSDSGSSDRQRPTYTDQSSRGTTPRPQTSAPTDVQRSGSSDSGAGGNRYPDRAERSSGPAPVLRRPEDSRSSRDGAGSPKPPVLRRPNDPQQGEGGSSQGTVNRPSAGGQQQGGGAQQQGDGEDDVVKLESTLVNMPLLVSDRSGRYIPQLSARDFALYEDGVQQTIASFGTEEVPFSVALLLDVSPSVQGNIEDIQDAAIAFVRQLRSQDRVMIVSFDRQVHYLSDFTSDRRELEWAIRRANTGSGTSVYDAVFEVVQRKLRNIDGRKALILFSDGEDTTSGRASYDDAIDIVTESDVLVYGLRYPGNGGRGGVRVDPWPRNPIPGIQLPFPFPWPFPRRRRGPFRLSDPTAGGNSGGTSVSPQWPRRRGGGGDFMADITAAGGGPVYDAEKISDLSRVAYRIAEELRHVYVISYYPTNPLSHGGYRSVRVSVKGRDDIAVRHRRGYNAGSNKSAKPTT